MFKYSNVNGDDFQIFEMIRDEKCDCQFKQIFVEAIIFENVQIFDDFQIFEMIRDEKCDCPLPLTGKFCERAELVQVYLIAQLKCFTFGYLFVV